MKKKLLILALAVATSLCSKATTNDAVYVWVNGSSTCYQLEKYPKVKLKDGTAILTINGVTEPVLQLKLENGAELKCVFGIYKPTGINEANTDGKVVRNGKFISGGQLIIIKDGKQYTANGVLLNK